MTKIEEKLNLKYILPTIIKTSNSIVLFNNLRLSHKVSAGEALDACLWHWSSSLLPILTDQGLVYTLMELQSWHLVTQTPCLSLDYVCVV